MAQWFAGRFTGRKETAAPHARAPLDENATAAQAAHNGGDLPEARPAAPQQPIILEVAPQPVAPEGRAPSAAPPPLPSINNYVLKQTLGVGAFGKVKLAEHKETGQLFAIKCIQKSRISAARQFERLQREIRILKMLRHPNVIQLHVVIETDADIFLVMEHVAGGDLLDFINSRGAMPEEQARDLVGQITCGLQFCHSLGVAHRDLKPENILVNEAGVVKITDFGLSNMQNAGEQLSTLCGSPYYAAPELLDGSTTRYGGMEADIWSVGVITFAILCGELPFDGQTLPDLFAKITCGAYAVPAQLSLSRECRDILACMLVRAPSARTKMLALRNHPWMRGATAGAQLGASAQAAKRRAVSAVALTAKAGRVITDLERSALDSLWRERNLNDGVMLLGACRLERSASALELPARTPRVPPPDEGVA